MPNAIKYTSGNLTGSLQKSNIAFGVTTSSIAGPTEATRWYSGITPSAGKYVIYETVNPAVNPNIYCPVNDVELIQFVKSKGATGNNTASLSASLAWIGTQGNLMAANFEYENIVTDGLLLNLDAGFVGSYPTTGSTWYDISGNASNGTLINGPTFNSANSGSIVFDGVDDYAQCAGSFPLTEATIITWIRRNGSQMSFAGVFFTRGGSSITGLNFYYDTNKIGYHWNTSYYDFDSNLTIPDLTWCMVALSVTSTAGILYLCQSSGITTATNTNSHPSIVLDNIKLAQDDTVEQFGLYRFFKGNIAISQVYNRALSSREITQNFTALKGRFGI